MSFPVSPKFILVFFKFCLENPENMLNFVFKLSFTETVGFTETSQNVRNVAMELLIRKLFELMPTCIIFIWKVSTNAFTERFEYLSTIQQFSTNGHDQ